MKLIIAIMFCLPALAQYVVTVKDLGSNTRELLCLVGVQRSSEGLFWVRPENIHGRDDHGNCPTDRDGQYVPNQYGMSYETIYGVRRVWWAEIDGCMIRTRHRNSYYEAHGYRSIDIVNNSGIATGKCRAPEDF